MRKKGLAPKLAKSDAEIQACYSVLCELRPELEPQVFLERIRAQQREGYQLAYLSKGRVPVAVAGFRIGENLAWGRFLYVDDLVTTADTRSQGHGSTLLRWLQKIAKAEGCQEIHLDSGVQRKAAHRFYEKQGMQLASFHFRFSVE